MQRKERNLKEWTGLKGMDGWKGGSSSKAEVQAADGSMRKKEVREPDNP